MGPIVTGATAFLVSLGASAATAALIVDVGIKIGTSLLLSTAANALMGGGASRSQQDVKLSLAQPTSLPEYRYVYGRDLAVGTPAPVRVRGSKIYGCWILNSRPSAMTNLAVLIDKRQLTWTGDPFDFAAGGAQADSGILDGYVTFWIGRGDQTAPPADVLSGAPHAAGADEELYKTTDGWQGRTVLWAIFDAGPNDERQERWINAPPLIEVLADWSKVYDPRDLLQDADDPDTWEYSANHALVCLDAARTNPVRPFTMSNVILDQFIAAADISDQNVALKAGGTEKRYTIGGTIVWDASEIHSQLGPLFAAGGARPIHIGGPLGISPGVYEPPSYTLTDFIGRNVEYVGVQTGDRITQLRTTYTNPDRFFETSALLPYEIPGALSSTGGIPRVRELNLELAGSPQQAMRVQKIEGELIKRERTIKLTAPPSAANLIGGSAMTVGLPAPWSRLNGIYRIEAIDPESKTNGNGVSMKCPIVARQYDEAIYAYTAATDEQDIIIIPYNTEVDGVSATLEDPVSLDANESAVAGTISVAATAPNDQLMTKLEFWMGPTTDIADATVLSSLLAQPNNRYQRSAVVGGAVTRSFWVRATGNFGSASAFVGPVTVTTA